MRIKKKKNRFLIFLALVTALLFLGGIVFWWLGAIRPVGDSTRSQIFVVKKGEGLNSIAERLDKQGLVKSSLAFRILVLSKGLAEKIQAGDFRLNPSLTTEELVSILTHGTLDVWLTFPEGWRREEFGRRLSANLDSFDYGEFLDLTEAKEGFLFPDTYLIPQEATSSMAVKILTDNFKKKFSSDLEKAAQAGGLTTDQVVTMASIVEREAGQDDDRPLIAGILIKRWRNDWPLQADATIQYALGSLRCSWEVKNGLGSEGERCDFWKPIKPGELETNSPYNTYQYRGLPPTPICNPGLASIKAVIYPKESDYWFYLSEPDGSIHYAETNAEHNQNKKRYL